MSLHKIGLKYNTDKATYHNFCEIYDNALTHLKESQIKFMEIGIWKGHSLKMWYEYLTNAKIYGVDILDRKEFENDRIKTFIVNQEKETELKTLPDNMDVILEDGGHTMFQQQLTFKVLFNDKLKSGGIYILEDLHTSKEMYYKTHGSNPHNNTLNLLIDLKNNSISENSNYFLTKDEILKLKEQIESIDIYETKEDSITSIIKKK